MVKLFLAILFLFSSDPHRIYVSPTGSDTEGDGTAANPWKSMEKAKASVSELVSQGFSQNITVLFAEGTYELTSPIEFGTQDSAPEGATITYASQDGPGSAVFKSRSVITNSAGWTYYTNGIWRIDVGTGHDIDTLYEDGIRANEARYPNRGANQLYPQARTPYLISTDGGITVSNTNRSWVSYADGDISPETASVARHITLFPLEDHDWHSWTCEITSVETNADRINFRNSGDQSTIGEFVRFFVSGALGYLDAPGGFFYDPAQTYLYYKPRTPGNPAYKNISVPLLYTLIHIEGENNTNVVKGLRFDGLTFSDTAAIVPARQWWTFGWGKDDFGIVKMQNTSDIVFNECVIKNSGRHGILAVGQNRNIQIRDSLVENMGVSGITFCNRYSNSPDRLSDCLVSNCVVRNVGNLSLYASCIELMSTESCLVEHCELSDSARYAVTLRGNCVHDTGGFNSFPPSTGNRIRNCWISHCMQDSGDGAPLHGAGINDGTRDYINSFENIAIEDTYSVLGMSDPSQIAGVFLDWPNATLMQSFSNIWVGICEGPPIKLNDNPTQTFYNVSWEDGFNADFLTEEQIGLEHPLPERFGYSRPVSRGTADVIVDNNDENFSKTGEGWLKSNVGRKKQFLDQPDEPNSWLYVKKAGNSDHQAVWTPDFQDSGYYDVYVWKFETNELNATAVDYHIVSAEGDETVSVNQNAEAKVWERLGTRYFDSGTNGYVRMDADSAAVGEHVRADAVRFSAVLPAGEIQWETDFENGYAAGSDLIGQNDWQAWFKESPVVQSNAVDGFYIQGVSTDDTRAKCGVNIETDRFAVIQFSSSIPNTTALALSQNQVGLGSLSANSIGLNLGINAAGVFVATNGIAMDGFVYGYIGGTQFVPDAGTVYTLKAKLNLLAGTAKLFVSTDGIRFEKLAFNAGGTLWKIPFDLSQVSGWNAVYLRTGEHLNCRIYDIIVTN